MFVRWFIGSLYGRQHIGVAINTKVSLPIAEAQNFLPDKAVPSPNVESYYVLGCNLIHGRKWVLIALTVK